MAQPAQRTTDTVPPDLATLKCHAQALLARLGDRIDAGPPGPGPATAAWEQETTRLWFALQGLTAQLSRLACDEAMAAEREHREYQRGLADGARSRRAGGAGTRRNSGLRLAGLAALPALAAAARASAPVKVTAAALTRAAQLSVPAKATTIGAAVLAVGATTTTLTLTTGPHPAAAAPVPRVVAAAPAVAPLAGGMLLPARSIAGHSRHRPAALTVRTATPAASSTPTATSSPTATASPSATASPTATASPAPGVLTVTAASTTLASLGSTVTVQVTAVGGPVTWAAITSDPGLTVAPATGTLAAGQTADLTVTLAELPALGVTGGWVAVNGTSIALTLPVPAL